jgi:hypothetical protein
MEHETAQHNGSSGFDDERRRGLFEDRYGAGAIARLIARLKQPCVSFATIAAEFGVTRECVRQWHLELLPGAPQGHARRRLCLEYERKRRLFADALFRAFYQDVRRSLGAGRLTLIRSADGFRRRRVQIDGRPVALHDARPSARRRPQAATHEWSGVEFVYVRLSDEHFLFLPSAFADAEIDARTVEPAPERARYLNTFEALYVTEHTV